MPAVAFPRKLAFLLLVSCLPFAPQEPTNPPQQEPTAPSTPPAKETPQQPEIIPNPALPPKEEAWQLLDTACDGAKTSDRAAAVRVLGLLAHSPKALKMAEKALEDDKPEVRSAGAAALGEMGASSSIAKLKAALDDKDPTVVLAAAHSLELMHDATAYEIYYEVLTGERKTGKGMIASETSLLKDPKKLARLGVQEGIGFIPFAGIGWEAFKVINKDDSSPVRAAAAKVLAKDPDPGTRKALVEAVTDKSWLVRAAALEALARRGDPSALKAVSLELWDDKDVVKYTAAAAVLRLTAIKEAGPALKQERVRKKRK